MYAFQVTPVNLSQMYRLGVPALLWELQTGRNNMACTWNTVRYITYLSKCMTFVTFSVQSIKPSDKWLDAVHLCCMNLEPCVIMWDSMINRPTKSPRWLRTSRERWTGRRLPSGEETRVRWKKKNADRTEGKDHRSVRMLESKLNRKRHEVGVEWYENVTGHGGKKDQGIEGDLHEDGELNPLYHSSNISPNHQLQRCSINPAHQLGTLLDFWIQICKNNFECIKPKRLTHTHTHSFI